MCSTMDIDTNAVKLRFYNVALGQASKKLHSLIAGLELPRQFKRF